MPTSEVQTGGLVREALRARKDVFVPYIYAMGKGMGKGMEMLKLESVEEWEGMQRDGWGIPKFEPDSIGERENAMGGRGVQVTSRDSARDGLVAEEGGLDLIIVPGVAFDQAGARLGHGKGFYDQYLTRLVRKCKTGDGRGRPVLVGLCLVEQVRPVGEIPMEEWDWRMDIVVVGDGRVFKCDDIGAAKASGNEVRERLEG